MPHRTAVEIIIDILEVCKEPRYITRLLGITGINHVMAVKYVGKLVKAGYLECVKDEQDRNLYLLTEKGREALRVLIPLTVS